MAHTQGKRHQTNLAKRAAREAKEAPAQPQPHKRKVSVRKTGAYFIFVSQTFCRTPGGHVRIWSITCLNLVDLVDG